MAKRFERPEDVARELKAVNLFISGEQISASTNSTHMK
jgi:hypothetical protein